MLGSRLYGFNPGAPEFKVGSSLYPEYFCLNLGSSWFPPNPEALSEISLKLRRGDYRGETALLVEDIRSDFSLFGFCVREMALTARGLNPGESGEGLNPLRMLRQTEFAKLQEILETPPQAISKHSWSTLSAEQEQIFVSAMVSATAAEALSPGMQTDSDLAFCCALFRQLGLTLIACNYPHVYRRALQQVENGQDLDEWLRRVLGVGPSHLGLTLARKWGFSKTLRRGMGEREQNEDPATRLVGERLEKLAQAGEALARINNGSRLPQDICAWDSARAEIEKALGSQGLSQIAAQIKKRCRLYKNVCPQFFEESRCGEIDSSIRQTYSRRRLARNKYLAACPEFLRRQLEELYQKLDGLSVDSDAIQTLVKHCALSVGFVRGCVYLLDPDGPSLEPRLTIGEGRLCLHRAVRRSLSGAAGEPVAGAYLSGTVLSGRTGAVCYLAGALGNAERLGVLYLEVPKTVVEARGKVISNCFYAINQALGDCLNVC